MTVVTDVAQMADRPDASGMSQLHGHLSGVAGKPTVESRGHI
jgi:hypothetical protein